MRKGKCVICLLLCVIMGLTWGQEGKAGTKPKADTMVKVRDYIPDIKVDLRYSTTNNFTGKKIYNFKEAYLRYGTVVKLKRVQKQLKKDNLTLLNMGCLPAGICAA